LRANDYTSGGTSFNGSGNFPMMGTGNTVFFNWVIALEKFFRKKASQTRVQPNVAIQYSDFEGLNEAMVVLILGQPVF
jgi:hypothetical protein